MKTYKDSLLHRLAIIRGHLEKIITMVDKDEYCMDILQQTTAVENALRQVDQKVLENHLRHCVTDAILNKRDVEQKVEEVIKVFNAMK